ncbi:MAG: hypothetical protein SH848_05640 [Saprospiraceae bacterium]|nr:hypothetical protein [Saprospiraceae bacterium]
MSTSEKKQATDLSSEEKEQLLNQSIKAYELEDWVGTIPGGFQTLRLLSDWKIALIIIKLMVALFIFLKDYSELDAQDSGWFTVLTALVALAAFAFIFVLTRSVVFDLENGEIYVTL